MRQAELTRTPQSHLCGVSSFLPVPWILPRGKQQAELQSAHPMPATKSLPDAAIREAFDHADEVVAVTSEAIASLRYDSITETLFLTFVNGGTYFYRAVPGDVFEAFKAADSKGRFFQANILDRFDFGQL